MSADVTPPDNDEMPLKVGDAIELRTYEDPSQRPAVPRP